ncbi:hypothetical protein APX70_04102, partial [Pseudomonas syringae pv. maculicola]
DRWLGQVQVLCGCGKAAMRDDQRERVQVIEVESLHGKVFLMLWMINHSFFNVIASGMIAVIY